MNKKSLKERLMGKIIIDEASQCWNWTGSKSKGGYGRISINSKPQLAHRISYGIFISELSPELEVCHKCDNPSCINPCHLFAGTHRENMADCKKKGRARSLEGEENKRAKLTRDDVIFIRRSSMTNTALGKMFGVSNVAVSYARSGKSWGSISEGLHGK